MIIGISGLAGSGKDTCADFLMRDRFFVKVSLADPLKRMAREAFDFTDEQLWGPSSARNAPDLRYPRPDHVPGHTCACCGSEWRGAGRLQCYLTPRYALQQLGTEWGRNCYPNVWVDHALRVADKLSREGGYVYGAHDGLRHPWRPGDGVWRDNVVVPDIRFKNEIDAFKKSDAYLIRVVRPSAGLSGSAGSHVSETEQNQIPDEMFDVVIVNDGTLEELRARVLDIGALSVLYEATPDPNAN